MKDYYFVSDGFGKILRNLMIPMPNGGVKKIDRLLIHETGFYIFDTRDEEGAIRGSYKDDTWTSSARNCQDPAFENPIRALVSREEALQALYPGISIHLFIVFAAEHVDVQVTDWEFTKATVCRSEQVEDHFRQMTSNARGGLRPQKIDEVFRQLLPYAEAYPMQEQAVTTAEITNYADLLEESYAKPAEKTESTDAQAELTPTEKRTWWSRALLFCFSALAVSVCLLMLVKYVVDNRVNERNSVLQKEYESKRDSINTFSKYIKEHSAQRTQDQFNQAVVQNVYLVPVYDGDYLGRALDMAAFQCSVQPKGTNQFCVGEDASIVVGFRNGTGIEYRNISPSEKTIRSNQSWFIGPILISQVQVSDIAFINLCGVRALQIVPPDEKVDVVPQNQPDSSEEVYLPTLTIPLYTAE